MTQQLMLQVEDYPNHRHLRCNPQMTSRRDIGAVGGTFGVWLYRRNHVNCGMTCATKPTNLQSARGRLLEEALSLGAVL